MESIELWIVERHQLGGNQLLLLRSMIQFL